MNKEKANQKPSNHTLKSIHIEKLKGIEKLEIDFPEASLVALMGINGIGKSTILHALACCFSPPDLSNNINYKFYNFFIPNPDSRWRDSIFWIDVQESASKTRHIHFKKDSDRWMPKYANRIKKNVFYIGIDSCVPAVEKEKNSRKIEYKNHEKKIQTQRKF